MEDLSYSSNSYQRSPRYLPTSEKEPSDYAAGHLFSDDLFREHPYRSLLISFICVNRHVNRAQIKRRMNLSQMIYNLNLSRVNTEHM